MPQPSAARRRSTRARTGSAPPIRPASPTASVRLNRPPSRSSTAARHELQPEVESPGRPGLKEVALQPIPFNRPLVLEAGYRYLREAVALGHLSGDGPFT